jgi:DNA-binding NarL/FixJ family response regulator
VGDAPDGTSGIAAVLDLRPEIVLLDVRLPDIDGFTVATRLADEYPQAAVVMMSSSDDPLYPELARQSRARGFVAKHDISGAALQALLG